MMQNYDVSCDAKNRVLVVEDDMDLSGILSFHLANQGFQYTIASNCLEATDCLALSTYDAILLDIMLPDGIGFDLCKVIRQTSNCPIIFMSCMDSDAHISEAFMSGCDDYIVKPLNYKILTSKLSANIERYNLSVAAANNFFGEDTEVVGNIQIDKTNHYLIIDEQSIYLSPIEFNLFLYFCENQGKLLLYKDIYNAIWHEPDLNDYRTVMVHVSNLRKKMGNCQPHIKTLRGAGYIFVNEEYQ